MRTKVSLNTICTAKKGKILPFHSSKGACTLTVTEKSRVPTLRNVDAIMIQKIGPGPQVH